MAQRWWSTEDVADASRRRLSRADGHPGPHDSWSLVEVQARDQAVVVRFRRRGSDDVYAATVPVGDPLRGPCTDEEHENLEDWSEDLLWRLMEEADTGAVLAWPRDPVTGDRVATW